MFILKIYFIGLIAFAPGPRQGQMQALLVDAREDFSLSDGTRMGRHLPLLVARDGECVGDCPDQSQQVADFLFAARASEPRPDVNLEQLRGIIPGDGAWVLDQSKLSLELPAARGGPRGGRGLRTTERDREARNQPLPVDSEDAGGFDWVADISELAPSCGGINPQLLQGDLPKGLLAARFSLAAGTLKTETLASMGGSIVTLSFAPLASGGEDSARRGDGAVGAYANWVAAEILVENGPAFIVDSRPGSERRLKLTAEEGEVVEVAIVNLPQDSFAPSDGSEESEVGKHFEAYYRLAQNPNPQEGLLVPFRAEGETRPWEQIYPPPAERSSKGAFLEAIGLLRRGNPGRPICLVARF